MELLSNFPQDFRQIHPFPIIHKDPFTFTSFPSEIIFGTFH